MRKYTLGLSANLRGQGTSWLDAETSLCLLTQSGCAELRIHEEIERGNNDSVKKESNLAAATGLCGAC